MKYYLVFFLGFSAVYSLVGVGFNEEIVAQPAIVQLKIDFSGIVMVNVYDMAASVKPGGTPGTTLSFMGPHVKGRRVTYDVDIPLSKTPQGNGKNIVVIARGVNGEQCHITGFGYSQLLPKMVLIIDKKGRATIQSPVETKGNATSKL